MPFQRRQLAVLIAVDDAGSIHGAAQQLGIAQSAVSRTVGEVERSIGAALFERGTEGSFATPRGQALLNQARSILRALERLDAVAGTRPGPVRLGCIPSAMHTLMPRLLSRQSSTAARALQLKVFGGDSGRLCGALQRGELDFAVMRHVERAKGAGAARLPPIEPMIETLSFESSAALVKGTALLALLPELIARQYQREGRVVVLTVAPRLPTLPILLVARQAVSDDPLLATLQRQLFAAALQTRVALAGYRGRARTRVA